jgi:hypothetical protein
MKKTAIATLAMGAIALALLVAAPSLGLELAEDVRTLLLVLASGLEGLAAGSLLPQAE